MKEFDYIAEANVTASNQFHGEKVKLAEVIQALQDFASAAERLDRIKKAIFYGRDYIANPSRPQASVAVGNEKCDAIISQVAAYDPDFIGDTYFQPTIDNYIKLFHAIVGVATESGEMVEAWLDSYKFGKTLDLVNLSEEFGDNFWYCAIGIDAVAKLTGKPLTFESVQRQNIGKLRLRFPNKFTEFDANNRDLTGEREFLETELQPQAATDENKSG